MKGRQKRQTIRALYINLERLSMLLARVETHPTTPVRAMEERGRLLGDAINKILDRLEELEG